MQDLSWYRYLYLRRQAGRDWANAWLLTLADERFADWWDAMAGKREAYERAVGAGMELE